MGGGGAEGIRTPDLLIANETLYQLSYDPVPKCAKRCRFGGGVARTGFDQAGFDRTGLGSGRVWGPPPGGRPDGWARKFAGIGSPASAPEIGAGLDDATHLVEPPRRALAAARAEVSHAPGSSALGGHGHIQGQPGGGGVGDEFQSVVRTIHVRSVEEWIRHWLSEGSLAGARFFQTFSEDSWCRWEGAADEVEGDGVGS